MRPGQDKTAYAESKYRSRATQHVHWAVSKSNPAPLLVVSNRRSATNNKQAYWKNVRKRESPKANKHVDLWDTEWFIACFILSGIGFLAWFLFTFMIWAFPNYHESPTLLQVLQSEWHWFTSLRIW